MGTTNFGGDSDQVSLSSYHYMSFLDAEDEQERQITNRHIEVAMHVLRQVFEELVQLFERWEDREYVHRVYKFWAVKKFSVTAISQVVGKHSQDVLSDLRSYKPEWQIYDWVWSKDGRKWIEAFDIEPADFILAAKDFAFEARQPGVTESWLRGGSEDHLPRKLQTSIFNYKKKARRKLDKVHSAKA